MIYVPRFGQPVVDDKRAPTREFYQALRSLVDAAQLTPTTTQTSSYKASPYQLVVVDPTSGVLTVTLPATAGNFGAVIGVKNHSASTNAITLDGNGKNIDGSGTATITTARQAVLVQCIGDEWVVLLRG